MRVTEFETVFTDGIPHKLEQGKLYVCKKDKLVMHLCPCGCGEYVMTPIDGSDYSWQYTNHNGKITLRPSIGNFSLPCKSHYYITENRVEWV